MGRLTTGDPRASRFAKWSYWTEASRTAQVSQSA